MQNFGGQTEYYGIFRSGLYFRFHAVCVLLSLKFATLICSVLYMFPLNIQTEDCCANEGEKKKKKLKN